MVGILRKGSANSDSYNWK